MLAVPGTALMETASSSTVERANSTKRMSWCVVQRAPRMAGTAPGVTSASVTASVLAARSRPTM